MVKRLLNVRIALSKILPQQIKTSYRFLSWIAKPWKRSPPIPQDLLENCSVVQDRLKLIDRLPKNGCVAEIGVWKAEFTKKISTISAPAHFVCVDINLSMARNNVPDNFPAEFIEATSVDASQAFRDFYFDWVYIDAGHDYSSVLRDIEAWMPKVKKEGFLVFNDFAHIDPYFGRYGVHRAVSEFIVRDRWEVAFLALNTAALYDIAIVKPK